MVRVPLKQYRPYNTIVCRGNVSPFSKSLSSSRMGERLIETNAWKKVLRTTSLTRPESQGDTHSQDIPQLSDAQYHPSWLDRGRSYIGHEVEASTPVLGKLGTSEGLGSQWCNRLPR